MDLPPHLRQTLLSKRTKFGHSLISNWSETTNLGDGPSMPEWAFPPPTPPRENLLCARMFVVMEEGEHSPLLSMILVSHLIPHTLRKRVNNHTFSSFNTVFPLIK